MLETPSQLNVLRVFKGQHLAAGVWLLLVPGLKELTFYDSCVNPGKTWKNNLRSRITGFAICRPFLG